MPRRDLPLLVTTPDAWGEEVLKHPLELLNDHAHLERKAGTNALELLHRWPDQMPPESWVHAMTAVARDEVEHLAIVTRLLARRHGTLTRSHSNGYAAGLRDLVRMGAGPQELLDRLIVSALIEARSCERFEILSRCSTDQELSELYASLWASEHGHYRVFLSLGAEVLPASEVDARWGEMLEAESEIIQRQSPGPSIHSWFEQIAC